MATYKVIIKNPILGQEVMRIETDDKTLALTEAANLSRLHGIALVYEDSSDVEIARFRYGSEENYLA